MLVRSSTRSTVPFAANPGVLRHTENVSDYERAAVDLAGAIRLGYESEQDDPSFHFKVPLTTKFDGSVTGSPARASPVREIGPRSPVVRTERA